MTPHDQSIHDAAIRKAAEVLMQECAMHSPVGPTIPALQRCQKSIPALCGPAPDEDYAGRREVESETISTLCGPGVGEDDEVTKHRIEALVAYRDKLLCDLGRSKETIDELRTRIAELYSALAECRDALERSSPASTKYVQALVQAKTVLTRVLRDSANEVAPNQQVSESDNALQSVHACKECGAPGAVMHYLGGYLCPGGPGGHRWKLPKAPEDDA